MVKNDQEKFRYRIIIIHCLRERPSERARRKYRLLHHKPDFHGEISQEILIFEHTNCHNLHRLLYFFIQSFHELYFYFSIHFQNLPGHRLYTSSWQDIYCIAAIWECTQWRQAPLNPDCNHQVGPDQRWNWICSWNYFLMNSAYSRTSI